MEGKEGNIINKSDASSLGGFLDKKISVILPTTASISSQEQLDNIFSSLENAFSLKVQTNFKKTQSELGKLKKTFSKDISEKIKEVENTFSNRVDDSKFSVIETLAIFVALFTFVSIEFQIFRSFTSWQSAVSLTLIILGALTFFILTIDFILKTRSKVFLTLFILPIVLIAGGIYYFGQSKIIDSDYVLINSELQNMIQDNQNNTAILNCLNNAGYWRQKCFEN